MSDQVPVNAILMICSPQVGHVKGEVVRSTSIQVPAGATLVAVQMVPPAVMFADPDFVAEVGIEYSGDGGATWNSGSVSRNGRPAEDEPAFISGNEEGQQPGFITPDMLANFSYVPNDSMGAGIGPIVGQSRPVDQLRVRATLVVLRGNGDSATVPVHVVAIARDENYVGLTWDTGTRQT